MKTGPPGHPGIHLGRAARREERQEKVARHYIQGKSLREIGAMLGAGRTTICRDLDEVRTRWKFNAELSYDQRVARECATIDRVETEAWAAWERSCLDRVQERTEQEAVPASGETPAVKGRVKHVVAREGQAGDPRFLAVIENCVERRCRILGIEAPRKLEHSGPGGGPIETVDLNERADRIRRIVARIEAGEAEPGGVSGDRAIPPPVPGRNGQGEP